MTRSWRFRLLIMVSWFGPQDIDMKDSSQTNQTNARMVWNSTKKWREGNSVWFIDLSAITITMMIILLHSFFTIFFVNAMFVSRSGQESQRFSLCKHFPTSWNKHYFPLNPLLFFDFLPFSSVTQKKGRKVKVHPGKEERPTGRLAADDEDGRWGRGRSKSNRQNCDCDDHRERTDERMRHKPISSPFFLSFFLYLTLVITKSDQAASGFITSSEWTWPSPWHKLSGSYSSSDPILWSECTFFIIAFVCTSSKCWWCRRHITSNEIRLIWMQYYTTIEKSSRCNHYIFNSCQNWSESRMNQVETVDNIYCGSDHHHFACVSSLMTEWSSLGRSSGWEETRKCVFHHSSRDCSFSSSREGILQIINVYSYAEIHSRHFIHWLTHYPYNQNPASVYKWIIYLIGMSRWWILFMQST